jgi:Putative peptidoglycan binding domain
MVWLLLVLLTACVTSHPGGHQAGTVRPAVDRLLTRGQIQFAEARLQDFGFDPGPVDGIFTAQTQAAVRAYQPRYGLEVTGRLDRATQRGLLPGFDQGLRLQLRGGAPVSILGDHAGVAEPFHTHVSSAQIWVMVC